MLRVAELFAGVGGFRLGLERAGGFEVVWSNQWEPSTRRQHASDCYVRNFGPDGHSCEDIAVVMDAAEGGSAEPPDVDLVCGGFPCQPYSVATTLNLATGIEGGKGILWWEIVRLLRLRRPRFGFFENVDRMLKSPARQRGRDFAIMLACLRDLGYTVQWRVVNAAAHGFAQKRRRVFVVASLDDASPEDLWRGGALSIALPASTGDLPDDEFKLTPDIKELSDRFGLGRPTTPFRNAGVMVGGRVWTRDVTPTYDGPRTLLGDVLLDEDEVPDGFFIPDGELAAWRYLKGSKREPRTHASGATYFYTEGAIPFPDPVDQPSRTILTGEGGRTPSRFKHVVRTPSGRYRRLTPVELERLNGFPDGWTEGMPDGRRAFCMGNALVIGVVERIARALASAQA